VKPVAVAALWLLAVGAAQAAPVKVAIAPLHDVADNLPLEKALIELAGKLPDVQLVNVAGGKLQPPKPGAQQRVLQAEVARLGEGRILYLQATAPTASTTVALKGSGGPSSGDRDAIEAALVKVLRPDRYNGRLQLKIDVPNAELQLDGKKLASATGTLEVPVGTHALRVTHPAYRDFLRFVDVEYDKTLPIDVALSAYPLAEGEMTEKLRQRKQPKKQLPWYRTWWALSLAGVVLTGATTGLVYGLRPGVSADKTVTYQAPPVP
jgi:hypothetical protein